MNIFKFYIVEAEAAWLIDLMSCLKDPNEWVYFSGDIGKWADCYWDIVWWAVD